MASKKETDPGQSNASALDEYGVWVHKAIVTDSEPVSDLPIADIADEMPMQDLVESPEMQLVDDMTDDWSGCLPEEENIAEREARLMSDMKNNNTKLADESEAVEISLDDSNDLIIPDTDDLSDLSDLLMSIDEDTSDEETVFLEDEDLSLDLDSASDDLLLENEINDSPLDEELDESIVIPGLDDLNLDETLEVDSLDIPGIEGLSAPDETENLFVSDFSDSNTADISFEETSDNEVVIQNDASLDLPEVSLSEEEEEEILGLSEIDFDKSEDLLIEETLPDIISDPQNDDTIFNEAPASIDADQTSNDKAAVVFDEPPLSFVDASEIVENDLLPKHNESDLLQSDEEETIITVGHFDDITAVEEKFNKPENNIEPTPIESKQNNGILRSIEDELHAIRSELIDLRSELKRLRTKDTGFIEEQKNELNSLEENLVDEHSDSLSFDDDEEKNEKGKGFFDDDEDETVALTGDELDNILNSAEFIEEEGEPSLIDDNDDEEIVIDTDDSQIVNANTSFEDAGLVDEFAPIDEIQLEEINQNSSDQDEQQIICDDSSVPSNSEIDAMANMDIEKELEGIESLVDDNDDFEIYTGNDISDLTIDIPESLPTNQPEPVEQSIVQEEVPPEPTSPEDETSSEFSTSLRNEIKAVLTYMDKLLESLPEEKIEEFARSEHFEVYKKLFDELGI